MQLNINSKAKLNNGVEIPYLGLGTYNIRGSKEVERVLHFAFDVGYRLIDTAAAYYNEEEIGKAIKSSTIPREEIFITTKLDNPDHGYNSTLKAFEISLKKLDCDYIDLYLIHWPINKKRNESWKAMEKLYEQGICKAIGVSNYTIRHLEELFNNSSMIPAVNQVEFNPFVFQPELLNFCNEHKILLEAYTPIARGRRFDNPALKKITLKYKKTSAQVMLRWSLQHNVIVIPKSSDEKRIKENADIFDFNLNEEDMKILNALDENLRASMDPHKID
jgi:diketogulonate reductase-like aldo/keto reductase